MSNPVERVNKYQCCEVEFGHEKFMEHLETVHRFVKGTKCRKGLIMALDGSDFYSNTYLWTIPCPAGDITAKQFSSGPRDKTDYLAMMTKDE
jgi:hypothetical protein